MASDAAMFVTLLFPTTKSLSGTLAEAKPVRGISRSDIRPTMVPSRTRLMVEGRTTSDRFTWISAT